MPSLNCEFGRDPGQKCPDSERSPRTNHESCGLFLTVESAPSIVRSRSLLSAREGIDPPPHPHVGFRSDLRLLNVSVAFGGAVADPHGPHQAAFGVIEDVTMDHPLAGPFVEVHQQPHR